MNQIEFKNKVQYALFLRHALSHSLNTDSFNVFLHCVTPSYPLNTQITKEKDDILNKVNGILTTGLDLDGGRERCPYGSISGVARFMGESKNIKVEDIVDYNFACRSRYVNTIILAIPKFIELPNGQQEFSSLNGTMQHFNRFNKACLLDISKGKYLPTEFTFGYQLLDRQTNTIKFWQNERHFSQLPIEEQQAIMQEFSQRITEVINYCREHYNAETIEDILYIMTQKHLTLLEDYFNDI